MTLPAAPADRVIPAQAGIFNHHGGNRYRLAVGYPWHRATAAVGSDAFKAGTCHAALIRNRGGRR